MAFDAPRLYHGRERALWAPAPAQLGELARWLQAQGVRTLAVVQPHDQGSLPEALKHGLATMDEHALAALDFDCVLILRTARKPAALKLGLLERLAVWMLSVTRFMVPSTERPVRGVKVAELLDVALQIAPPGKETLSVLQKFFARSVADTAQSATGRTAAPATGLPCRSRIRPVIGTSSLARRSVQFRSPLPLALPTPGP